MSAKAHRAGLYGHAWRKARAAVLAVSDICALCGQPGATTVDHIIPVSRGGPPLDPANLQPAHHKCNSSKGDRPQRRSARSRQW